MAQFRNGLSFDIEDWFHVYNYEGIIGRDAWDDCELRVEANTRRILEILARHQVRATFFVLGWVADRVPNVVKEIQEASHEVSSHGYSHRRLCELNPTDFRSDLGRSLEALGRAGATDVRGFRAPSFSIVRSTEWALDTLVEFGLTYDSSIYPTGAHPEYGIPGSPTAPYRVRDALWEIPLTVVDIGRWRLPVGGGGYFRLLPYAVTRWALRRAQRQGRPAIVYLHPWELDPDQPRVETPRWRQLRQRINLGRTAERLDALLGDFDFVPLGELVDA